MHIHQDDIHHDELHPTAEALFPLHDQKSWVITADGLICAPVGFYRILEQYHAETGKTAKTAVFAFNAEDLDLVPHPLDPTRFILRKPAYALEPLDALEASGLGALQRRIEDHQEKWLFFVLRYGNLYHTDRRDKDQGEYFSNNFIAYGIFPEFDEDGSVVQFHVSYRTNPYSKDVNFGLDQGGKDSLWHSVSARGIKLGSFVTRDETLGFIHDDFCERYQRFVEGREVQSWRDPTPMRNMEMWWYNLTTHMKSDQSLYVEALLSKAVELSLKPTISAVIAGIGIGDLEKEAERAEEKARGSELENIADIEGKPLRRVPLYWMKEEAVPNWVVVTKPDEPLLRKALPICTDLGGYIRKRMIDIINGYYPAMARRYVCESGHSFIMTREYHGMQVLIVNDDSDNDPTKHSVKRYITFDKVRAGRKKLPANLKELFSENEGVIVCVEKRHVSMPVLADKGEKILHKPPHDADHHFVHYFVKLSEVTVTPGLSPQLVAALQHHKKPEFLEEKPVTEVVPTEIISLFRRCQKALARHGVATLPSTAERLKRFSLSVGFFATAALAITVPHTWFGHTFGGAGPILFSAVAGGLLIKNFGEGARTPRGVTKFNVVASAITSAGLWYFAGKTGIDLGGDMIREKLQAFSSADNYETIFGVTATIGLGYKTTRDVMRVGRRVFGWPPKATHTVHKL